MPENKTNNSNQQKTLYFHVGLSKTGSTYVQNKFFHKLKGIKYIHTSKFYAYDKIIVECKENKLLFSREFDRQFEREVSKLAAKYPHAKIIVVLRSTEQWIASQYRRYVKNGGYAHFEDFIDIRDDKGIWKIKDAYFFPNLIYLKENFVNPPLVLFYEELKQDPHAFFMKIVNYTETNYNKEQISLSAKHKSYSDKQLLFVRNITQKLKIEDHYKRTDAKLSWFTYRRRWLVLHLALYLAKLIPLKYKTELIPINLLSEYKEFYKEDWNKCLEFSRNF
jgi:hypothetical protein